jgi:SAM-dependent methyltransferase
MPLPGSEADVEPASRAIRSLLACPFDHAELALAADGSSYGCRACGRGYPVEAGVVRFLDHRDPFYEGRFVGGIPWIPRRDHAPWSWPLWLMACGYVWAVRRHVPAGSRVLEIGCGGGFRYLAHRFRTIGLDVSVGSLARLVPAYTACVQADLTNGIPLPSASIDAAVSSFVWEHILPHQKPGVLAELRRVLRPGGKLVFLYDVDGRHPLYRRMQAADPALFQEILIDREGHSGWQTAAQNTAAFEAAGFRVLEHRGKEKLLIGPAMYDKVHNWSGGFRRLARVGLQFRYGWRFHLYNAASRVFDESVGRLLPQSWSRVMVTVCERV